ncbi:smoothelin-like protein 1 [Drosophila willistoni]|uniref:smoothelin-like protein 1 n=1 Tax=Drosophila willistoni TaxID=7260 RepID=UPI001F087571|nr:smoothelin-like protein 1 [Drosophila willistoni]
MSVFYEQLFEIQKLLWFLRAYPNSSPREPIYADWESKYRDNEDDSVALCCIRKIMLLMRLISADLYKENNHRNDKQQVSEAIMRCYQEIGTLFQFNENELSEVNNLLKLEKIFNEVSKCITEKLIVAEDSTNVPYAFSLETNCYDLNVKPIQKSRLCCLVSLKGRSRRSVRAITNNRKLYKKLTKQNLQLARKLEEVKLQRDLELISHKLTILKEKTLVSQTMMAKQKIEETNRDLNDTVANLQIENLQLKHVNNRKCIWNEKAYSDNRDPSKTAEVKPKELQNVKPFEGTFEETQALHTEATSEIVVETDVVKYPKNNVQESPEINGPKLKCYRKRRSSKILIGKRHMKQFVNCFMQVLSEPNESIFPKCFFEQPKPCVAPKAKEKNGNLPDLKKTISKSILAILKEEANRNAIGKTFGDRRSQLLKWCQKKVKPYGIPMYEFSLSWTTGHALCALIHAYRPDIMDVKYTTHPDPKTSLEHGIRIAKFLGIQTKFDISDIYQSKPKFEDVFNYIQDLYFCLESTKLDSQNAKSQETA